MDNINDVKCPQANNISFSQPNNDSIVGDITFNSSGWINDPTKWTVKTGDYPSNWTVKPLEYTINQPCTFPQPCTINWKLRCLQASNIISIAKELYEWLAEDEFKTANNKLAVYNAIGRIDRNTYDWVFSK